MTYRNIELSSLTTQNNFQITVNLNNSNFDYSKVAVDGSDILFYDNINGNLLSYWIEKWNYNGDSKIFVKIPNIGTINIYMYYNGISSVSQSNGFTVFDFFDDFSDTTLDLAKWVSAGPLNKITNGRFELNGGATAIFSKQNFTRPFIMEYDIIPTMMARVFSGAKDISGSVGWSSFEHDFMFDDASNNIRMHANYGTVLFIDGSYMLNGINNMRLDLKPTGADYYVNGIQKWQEATNSNPVKISVFNMDVTVTYVDNIKVRKYPEIQTIVGNEVIETCPQPTCNVIIT